MTQTERESRALTDIRSDTGSGSEPSSAAAADDEEDDDDGDDGKAHRPKPTHRLNHPQLGA